MLGKRLESAYVKRIKRRDFWFLLFPIHHPRNIFIAFKLQEPLSRKLTLTGDVHEIKNNIYFNSVDRMSCHNKVDPVVKTEFVRV